MWDIITYDRVRLLCVSLLVSLCLISCQSDSGSEADYDNLDIFGSELTDLQNKSHTLGKPGQEAVILIFIDPECPVSVFYVPKIFALQQKADSLNISFYTVFSSPFHKDALAKKFIKDYYVKFRSVVDKEGFLAKQLKPEVVPEVYILNQDNKLVYKGAINSEFASLGKRRTSGIIEYVDDILRQKEFHNNTYVFTDAVGCLFEPW